MSAGARRERLRIDASDLFDATAPGGAFGSGAPPALAAPYETAYELGLRYQFTPDGRRHGEDCAQLPLRERRRDLRDFAAFTNQFQFLRPQTARSHELGVELAPRGQRARATVFVIDVDDEIHLDPLHDRHRQPQPAAFAPTRIRARGAARARSPRSTSRELTATSQAKFREGVLPGQPFTRRTSISPGKTVRWCRVTRLSLRASWDFTPATRL